MMRLPWEPAASRLGAAGLDFAPVDPAGEFGSAARRQDARLLHPVLALDAALEIERLADAIYVGGGPVGNRLIGDHAHRVELLLDQHADAADALEIVERGRAHGARGRGPLASRRRLGALEGLRAHRA